MADIRGTTGVGLVNIRAFLLSGDETFREKFEPVWAKNGRRFNDLKTMTHLFTATQAEAFEAFSAAPQEFVPLPAKMFEIRGSKKWHIANDTLVTEAAPRASRLLNTLLGEKQADVMRQEVEAFIAEVRAA